MAAIAKAFVPWQQKSATEFLATSANCLVTLIVDAGDLKLNEVYRLPGMAK